MHSNRQLGNRLVAATPAFWLLISAAACLAEEGSGHDISALLRELDDESYQVRESADRRLRAIGPSVREKLVAAFEQSPPEVQYRVRGILEHFDRQQLTGAWQLVRWEKNGIAETGKSNIIYIDPDEWRAGQWKFEYRTNPLAEPRQHDAVLGDRVQLGIFKIEGDRLHLCVSNIGSDQRPTRFQTEEGDGFEYHVRVRIREE